jgi:hypothetical protein
LKEFGVDSKCFTGADTTKLKSDLEIFESNSEIEDISIEEMKSIKTNFHDPWIINYYEEFEIH